MSPTDPRSVHDPRSAHPKTAVIIPYYQEERGILRKAVLSAMSQEDVAGLEIVVVDDGSPAPARDDLKGLDLSSHVALKLIEQRNRGPGAARNRALDSLSSDTVYVAFLDSDDRWTANHLSNALWILDQGYDFYFADFRFSSSGQSAMARGHLNIDRQPCLDGDRRIHQYVEHARQTLLGSNNCIAIPTVVFRYSKFRDIRFEEAFFLGEDLTFCMDLVSRTSKIALCADVEAISGRGVHIYEGRGWDTPQAIWRCHQNVEWRKWLARSRLSEPREIDENNDQIRQVRKGFIANVLHELLNGRAFSNADIMRFLKSDPAALLHLVPVIVRQIHKKISERVP